MEMRVDPRKVAAGDHVETKIMKAVEREVKAGNLVFRGYDHGVAVYGKLPMKVPE